MSYKICRMMANLVINIDMQGNIDNCGISSGLSIEITQSTQPVICTVHHCILFALLDFTSF